MQKDVLEVCPVFILFAFVFVVHVQFSGTFDLYFFPGDWNSKVFPMILARISTATMW